MKRPTLPSLGLLTMALQGALGCVGPFSNALFEEDAEFLAALPSQERSTVDYNAGSIAGGGRRAISTLPGGAPDLREMTEEMSTDLNEQVMAMLETVDLVRSIAPTEREEGLRRWGPWAVPKLNDSFLLVEITRTGLAQYDWSFGVSEQQEGPWSEVYLGTHFAGSSVAQGDGIFSWDIGTMAEIIGVSAEGRVEVDYDNRVGREFLLELDSVRFPDSSESVSALYWYHQDPSKNGDFEYETHGDVNDNGTIERVQVRTRWTSTGSVRSDAWVSEGDFQEELSVTECWDDTGALVYLHDSLGIFPETGDASGCPFDDATYPEHI